MARSAIFAGNKNLGVAPHFGETTLPRDLVQQVHHRQPDAGAPRTRSDGDASDLADGINPPGADRSAGIVGREHVRAGGVAIIEVELLRYALLFDEQLEMNPADVCVVNAEIGGANVHRGKWGATGIRNESSCSDVATWYPAREYETIHDAHLLLRRRSGLFR